MTNMTPGSLFEVNLALDVLRDSPTRDHPGSIDGMLLAHGVEYPLIVPVPYNHKVVPAEGELCDLHVHYWAPHKGPFPAWTVDVSAWRYTTPSLHGDPQYSIHYLGPTRHILEGCPSMFLLERGVVCFDNILVVKHVGVEQKPLDIAAAEVPFLTELIIEAIANKRLV
ncbi:hypothetical protein C8R44DRAFT_871778 [Mycena epipterygia]|nr:hypothetical protein C8R44DRAFT_871778 [Mycena epipterygia]